MQLPDSSFVPVGEEGHQSISQKAKLTPCTWGSACANRVNPHALARGRVAEGYFQKGFNLGNGEASSCRCVTAATAVMCISWLCAVAFALLVIELKSKYNRIALMLCLLNSGIVNKSELLQRIALMWRNCSNQGIKLDLRVTGKGADWHSKESCFCSVFLQVGVSVVQSN